ncbi:hypothetical protein ACHAXA_009853 [Cyclostephanos tholiformis]|uniref:Uncharacterized protein n=1 Tax=Cyclostephanos tholiformis TaxID=382380 RepID=A0ABD3R2W1_9STRA
MIAESYEAIGKSNREMKTNPHDSIEDDGEAGLMGPSLGVFHGDGTPANMEITGGRSDPSTSAILQVQVSPTPRSADDGQRLPRSGRAHVGMALPPTPEPMPPSGQILDRNNQSLPLLEATCVDDVVYEAFPMPRTPRRYRVVIAGLIVVATAAIIAVIVVVVRGRSEWNDRSPSASPTTDIPTKAPEAFISSASIWVQYGPDIVGDAADDLLGFSVAASADASTLVIGAPGTGYVKVYRTNFDSGNRVPLGQTIYGDATGDQFGHSVDVATNGNFIVIGSPGSWENEDRPGYVRVFTLESDDDLGTNTWKQIGLDITGEVDGDEFGFSVSISEDGNIIAVGARAADGNNGVDSGRVRVYRMDDSQSDWIPIGNLEGEADGDNSGTSISLSADGTKVAIGTPLNDEYGNSTGYVKVYQMYSAGSSWEQLGQTLYGDDSLDYSGYSVDLSPDGNTLAIGSPGDWEDGSRPGYVRVYSLKVSDNDPATGSWEKIGLDIIGEDEGDQFGRSVSLSNDGRKIAIGGNFNDGVNGKDSGHVRVYRKVDSQSDWIQIGGDVDGEAACDYSGWSVSLSADGYKVAIGSPYYDDDIDDGAGHVRVYALE